LCKTLLNCWHKMALVGGATTVPVHFPVLAVKLLQTNQ